MADTLTVYLLALTSTMGQGIQATPISTTSTGTTSNSSTEVLDTVLGTYQFNAVGGRRYLVVINGLIGSCTVANTSVTLHIRDSQSASNPTSGSVLVASTQWTASAAGGPGQTGIALANSFVASVNGTHTLGFFSSVPAGGATFTPLGTRELFALDIGAF